MDDASWAALALSLTIAGGIWTWSAFRRRGVASGLRALGFTLLPGAAYFTKTLQMFTGIINEITTWAGHLVFNPLVWFGVVLGGVSAGLFVVSGILRRRQSGSSAGQVGTTPSAKQVSGRGAPAVADDDMAEIEALLRKRGIK